MLREIDHPATASVTTQCHRLLVVGYHEFLAVFIGKGNRAGAVDFDCLVKTRSGIFGRRTAAEVNLAVDIVEERLPCNGVGAAELHRRDIVGIFPIGHPCNHRVASVRRIGE